MPVVVPSFPGSASVAFSTNVDVNRNLDWFVDKSKLWIPWLADNIDVQPDSTITSNPTTGQRVFPVDPGNLYPGKYPYLVWTSPRNSDANREQGETGNIDREYNTYVGSYREAIFNSKPNLMLEQRRVYDTYSMFAAALKKNLASADPCPPTGTEIINIRLEHEVSSIYINTPSGIYVGALFIVSVEERYPDA